MSDLNLSLTIKAQSDTAGLSALLGELQKLGVDVSTLQPELDDLSKELDTLSQQQKLISIFRELQGEIGDTQKNLDGAKDRLRALTTELSATETPSKALVANFQQTSAEVSKLQATLGRQETQLAATASKFEAAGLEVKTLATLQSQLAERSSELSGRLQTVQNSLEGIAKTASDQKAVSDALKAIGLDAGEIATGITRAESQFLSAFQTIRTNAQTTEAQLRAALITVFQGVQTPAALRELDAELQQIVNSGRLSAAQIAAIRDQATKPIPDPTAQLRAGAITTASAMEELKKAVIGFLTIDAFRRFVTASVTASREAESAFKGLESVAEGTGAGISRAYDEATKLASNGILSLAQASQSLQNLLSRGYGIDQAVLSIQRLTDAAAFNRQAHLAWGESIVGATEGLRNENSELVDNAGITKNVSVIWKEYADRLGKTVDELTKAEKIQAEVNGIMKETEVQAGNTQKALEGFEGQVAKLSKSVDDLKVKIGDDLKIGLGGLAEQGAAVTKDWITPMYGEVNKLAAYLGYGISQAKNFFNEMILGKDVTGEVAEANRQLQFALEQITERYSETVDAVQDANGALTINIKSNQSAAAAARAQAESAAELQAAFKNLGVDIQAVNTGLEKTERDALSALDTIAKSATTSGSVLETSLLSALQKIDSAAGLTAFLGQLEKVIQSGRVAGPELETIIRLQTSLNEVFEKSGGSLQRFQDGLKNAQEQFTTVAAAADRFGQALKTLNVDLDAVTTGLSATENTALKAFQTITAEAQGASGVIAQSLINTIKELDSVTGFKALRDQLTALAESGTLTGNDLKIVTGVLQELNLATLDNVTSNEQLDERLAGMRERYQDLDSARTAEIDRIKAVTANLAEEKQARQEVTQEVAEYSAKIEALDKEREASFQAWKAQAAEQRAVTKTIETSWTALLPLWDDLTEATKAQVMQMAQLGIHTDNFRVALQGINATAARETQLLAQIEAWRNALEGGGWAADQARQNLTALARESQYWGEMATEAGEQARQALIDYQREIESAVESLQDLIARQRKDLGDERAYEKYQHQKRLQEIEEWGKTSDEASRLAQEAIRNENELYEQQLNALKNINKERQSGTETLVADELQNIAKVDLSGLDNAMSRLIDKLRQMLALAGKIPEAFQQSARSAEEILRQLESQAGRV